MSAKEFVGGERKETSIEMTLSKLVLKCICNKANCRVLKKPRTVETNKVI